MLTLRGHDGDSLIVAPETGGAIVGWRVGDTDLLRHSLPAAVMGRNVQMMGAFPLVPYANRIAHGRFRWEGRDYQLALNFGDHPHSIHGVGWQSAWTVEDVSDDSVRMSLVHTGVGAQARGWPFAFEAELTYTLQGRGLKATLRATSRHTGPAPMGIGLHPYFPRVENAGLRFVASGVWINGANSLPDHHEPMSERWDHRDGRRAGDEHLDNCFTGWQAPVRLLAGQASLNIGASGIFHNLQVFTPPWAAFYCTEPASHVPDAINRPDLPPDQAMHVLAPGETLSGTIEMLRPGPD